MRVRGRHHNRARVTWRTPVRTRVSMGETHGGTSPAVHSDGPFVGPITVVCSGNCSACDKAVRRGTVCAGVSTSSHIDATIGVSSLRGQGLPQAHAGGGDGTGPQ
jgi:hypothetical protein